MMNSNEPTLVEDVNPVYIEYAWSALLDLTGGSVRTGQEVLDLATKLLDKYPDAECAALVDRLSYTLKGNLADLTHIRRYEIYTDDDCSDDLTVLLACRR